MPGRALRTRAGLRSPGPGRARRAPRSGRRASGAARTTIVDPRPRPRPAAPRTAPTAPPPTPPCRAAPARTSRPARRPTRPGSTELSGEARFQCSQLNLKCRAFDRPRRARSWPSGQGRPGCTAGPQTASGRLAAQQRASRVACFAPSAGAPRACSRRRRRRAPCRATALRRSARRLAAPRPGTCTRRTPARAPPTLPPPAPERAPPVISNTGAV